MAAEKPIGRPRIQVPEVREAVRPLELSLDTAKASLEVARDAAEGKAPKKEHIEHLSEAVAHDLRQSGEQIGDEDVNRIAHEIKGAFEHSSKEPDITKLRLPTIGEYFDTLMKVQQTYGVEQYKKQLAAAGGAFFGLEIIQAAAQSMFYGILDRFKKDGDVQLKIFTQLFSDVQTVDKNNPGAIRSFLAKTLKNTAPFWGPILFRYGSLAIEKPAHQQFEKVLKGVSESVNQRVTESVMMSDRVRISDRSPTEILDIIERGKMATVDLIATTYMDLIPLTTAIVASGIPQYRLNKAAMLVGATRVIPLALFSKRNIEMSLAERTRIMQETQRLDSRIASTIMNLETAQVSGQQGEGAKELAAAMAEREAFFSGQRSTMRKQDRLEKLINLFYDDVTPFFVGLTDIAQSVMGMKNATVEVVERPYISGDSGNRLRKRLKPKIKHVPVGYNPQLLALALGSAGIRANEFKSVQQENKYAAHRIASLYLNNIMPDLADIAEMEALLGPWDKLDRPDGPLEKERKPASALPNLDISVRNLNVMGILNDVSFDIKQGEFVAIRAEKGEGKTTLLRTMLGYYKPDAGVVSYGGTNLEGIKKYGSESLNRNIGYAPQNAGFIDTMTLKENLMLWNKNIPETKITDVMQELGLEKLIPRLTETGNHFSGGEKRLLSIVRALLTNPKILFLDEPTANLDPASIDRLVGTLQAIRKNHPDTTIISVTHDEDFAKHTDRVINLAELNKKPELGDGQVYEVVARPT